MTTDGKPDFTMNPGDRILVTGAGGFIGRRVVASLLERGFTNVACLARPSPNPLRAEDFAGVEFDRASVEVIPGNLLSREDCLRATKDARLVFHLAAGRGE